MPVNIEEMLRDLEAADAAGDVELAQAIAARIKAAQAAPTPPPAAAPTPAPAAPAAPGGPSGPPPGMVAATPPAPAPGSVPGWGATPAAPGPAYNATDGMSFGQLLAAGAGQSVASTMRGGRQVWNYLTGDKEELARLQEEENQARIADADLLSTGAGRLGQIGGHVMQALLPAGAAAKGVQAARGGMVATVGTEAALGGGMGALMPTVEGESRSKNVKMGAVTGAALPFIGPMVRAGAQLPVTAVTGLARMAAPRGTGALMDFLARQTKNVNGPARLEAGKAIEEISSKARVPVTSTLAAKLRAARHDYADSLPKDVTSKIDEWLGMSKSGRLVIKGKALQEARSAIHSEAYDTAGLVSKGLKRVGKLLDEAIDEALPKAQVKALKAARRQYHTGVRSPFHQLPRVKPEPGFLPGLRDALTRPETKRAAGRGALQSVLSAWRSALNEDSENNNAP